jgi:hypothetical protein
MLLSKTNFLITRDCNKNGWLKMHKPDVYKKVGLSDFDLNIIDTGNQIDALARELFAEGVLVEDPTDDTYTKELLAKQTLVIYQPVFATDSYLAVADIIVWNETAKGYDLFEVKSSTATADGEGGRRTNEYVIDLAFQKVVLDNLNVPIASYNLVRLNKEYIRSGELSISDLFLKEDLSEEVKVAAEEIAVQMAGVKEYLDRDSEPAGPCDCLYKTKINHCSTAWYSLPDLPDYSVHRISRINKTKLGNLVDSGVLAVADVPKDFELSDIQRRQVGTTQSGQVTVETEDLNTFLEQLEYPLAFIDYETYPSAIPQFTGYRPYQQIPFQFSLHILDEPGAELRHFDFIHTDKINPDEAFLEAMEANIPPTGSILVWSQRFEKGINDQLVVRVPAYETFITGVQDRIVDLIEPFDGNKAVYFHPEFYGKSSIKFVLPALVPSMSYKNLAVQDGGMAADTWNRVVSGEFGEAEAQAKIEALREYCTQDTLAMVKIWEILEEAIK